MQAIEYLQNRVSSAKLQSPAPSDEICNQLIMAAVRAADHGGLTPWRFMAIRAQGLVALGEIFAEAAQKSNPDISSEALERFKSMPLRAPMILVLIARTQLHPKIPVEEQLLSAACAGQNILNAAFILGWGAIWRTGEMAKDPHVINALGLSEGEQIIGFIYLGTSTQKIEKPKIKSSADFLTYWP